MKTDINGTSSTQIGEEQYEYFTMNIGGKSKKLVQYDYRHTNGELFSTIASDLDTARAKRDTWLKIIK